MLRKLRWFLSGCYMTGCAVVLNTINTYASEGDGSELGRVLTDYAKKGKGLTIGLLAITIVVIGVCFILPVRRLNEWAKEHIVAIIVGAILINGAVNIAVAINNGGLFSGD